MKKIRQTSLDKEQFLLWLFFTLLRDKVNIFYPILLKLAQIVLLSDTTPIEDEQNQIVLEETFEFLNFPVVYRCIQYIGLVIYNFRVAGSNPAGSKIIFFYHYYFISLYFFFFISSLYHFSH